MTLFRVASLKDGLALFQGRNTLQHVMQYGVARSALYYAVFRVTLQYILQHALQFSRNAGGILQDAGDGPDRSPLRRTHFGRIRDDRASN